MTFSGVWGQLTQALSVRLARRGRVRSINVGMALATKLDHAGTANELTVGGDLECVDSLGVALLLST